jgi:hypothetical protein
MRLDILRQQLQHDLDEIDNLLLNSEISSDDELIYTTKRNQLQTDVNDQCDYATTILNIGNGIVTNDNNNKCTVIGEYDKETRTTKICLSHIHSFIDSGEVTETQLLETDIIQWLHPDGFNISTMTKKAIIACTNDRVNYWNTKIQTLNPNESYDLLSADVLSEVDDPYDILKNMLSTDVLNNFNDPVMPPHILTLKVNDICFICRTLSRKDK